MNAFPHPLESFATARPGHLALDGDVGQVTARTLLQQVAFRAAELKAQGIAPGHTTELIAAPTLDFVRDMLALSWMGATAAIVGSARTLARPIPDATAIPADVPLENPHSDLALNQVVVELRTSGSTGTPKRVPLTSAQILFNTFGSAARLGHLPTDRWLCCLALHHIGGLAIFWRTLTLQTTTVLHTRFDPHAVSRAIDDDGITLVSLVPDMLRRLLEVRGERRFPKTLRAILIGGEKCPPTVLEKARDIEAPIALSWGMTEVGSQLATRFAGDLEARHDSGPALPFTRLRSLPDGRLQIHGPTAPGGVLDTQDRGYVTPEGRVVIHGRADGMFIAGGENISPAAIEQALCDHPSVIDATVVPVVDDRWGQRPGAWVTTHDASLDEGTLRGFVRTRLERFEMPKTLRITPSDAVPRTPNGKTDRRAIRRHLEGGLS